MVKKHYQRWVKDSLVNDVLTDYVKKNSVETGWSIGNLFRGRYYNPKENLNFSEKSFSVDIRGADMKLVKDVGELLAKKFDQQAVLIIDHKTGKSSLLYP